jgi:hypothetical protein
MSACVTGKTRYSRLTAMIELADMQRRGRDERRVYSCLLCGGWHLTSQAKKPRPIRMNGQAGAEEEGSAS